MKKNGIEESIAFRIKKIWYRKKYRIQYWKYLVSKKISDLVLKKNYQKDLGFVCLKHGFVKLGIGIGISFKTFPFFWWYRIRYRKNWFKKVSDSVSQKFVIDKSIGFGIQKTWY